MAGGAVLVPQPERPPGRVPGHAFLGAVAALLLIAGLLLVGDVEQQPEAEEFQFADPVDELRSLATGWVAALNDRDVAAAVAMVAPDWEILELPGLPAGYFRDLERSRLADGLGLFSELMALDLGECALDVAARGTRLRCDAATVSSPYADAVLVGDVSIPMTFTARDGRLVSVFRGVQGAPQLRNYCFWAEEFRTRGISMFDLGCRPVLLDDAATLHFTLASGFVEAGRPFAPLRYRIERARAQVVPAFANAFNRGVAPAQLTSPALALELLPAAFAVRGAGIGADEIAAWTSVLARFEPGLCRVRLDGNGGVLGVHCPDALLSGPLVDGLGIEVEPYPVSFRIEGSQIAAISAGPLDDLSTSFSVFCSWLRTERPEAALEVFAEGCGPAYDAGAATRLLETLADFRAAFSP